MKHPYSAVLNEAATRESNSQYQTLIAELLQPQLRQRGTLPKCVREIYRKIRHPFSAMFILHNPSTDLVAETATGEAYNVPKIRSER